MNLFKKRCMYCREKIGKGQEKLATVTVLGYVGTFSKPFCNEEHVDKYKEEIKNTPKTTGGGCCG